MGQTRYVVDAILFEGRSPTELARTHTLSRSWIYKLVDRYKAGGYDALEPRSRRPRSCSHQVGPDPEFLRDGLRLVPPTRGDRADKQAHERVEQSDNHGDR